MAINKLAFETQSPFPRPFLKWVGGKRQLLPELRSLMPAFTGRYYEPFVGGGALFFDQQPVRATLSDLNPELVDCYTAVRDHVEDVIEALKAHVYDRCHYYETRQIEPGSLDLIERAARTIFLNRTGFNGLYRVNSRGEFNVPFGKYKNPTICDGANLLACSIALQGVSILCRSFDKVLATARRGDFVYFDPPYIPLSASASFTAYERHGFAMAEQERLARVFEELTRRGVYVMLSNSDVPWMHNRYAKFNLHRTWARRCVNCDATSRGLVGEVVVTSF